MAQNKKRLLIVDDTEIDRIILKSILAKDFEVEEATNGNAAFEYISTNSDRLDGILLDIVMPGINGFDVLRFMADKNVTNIPVFLVTAEPTRENVERAVQYSNIADFISKPFEQDDVLRRLRSRLGVIPEYDLKNEDLAHTRAYISELESIYKTFLTNFGRDDAHYRVMVDLMQILVARYSKEFGLRLVPEAIELISKAAYFCDIGEMLVPDKRLLIMTDSGNAAEMRQSHPLYGASIIRLNHAKSCEYFVDICANMCLHHHERWDGDGYPDRLLEDNNSVFNQMCRLVDEFELMRSKFYGDKSRPVKFVIKRLVNDNVGMVSPILLALMEDCEQQILDYFLREDT